MKICTTCGAQNENHHDMCSVCGTPLFAQASASEAPEVDAAPSQAGFFGASEAEQQGEAPLLEVEPIAVDEAEHQAPAEHGEVPLLEVEPIPVDEAEHQAPADQFAEPTLVTDLPSSVSLEELAPQPYAEPAEAAPAEGSAQAPHLSAPAAAPQEIVGPEPTPSEAARLADEIIAQAKSARATSVSLDDAPNPIQRTSSEALEALAALSGSETALEEGVAIPAFGLTGELEPGSLPSSDPISLGEPPEDEISLEALADGVANAPQAAPPLATSDQDPLSGDLDISALVDSTIEADSGLINVSAEQADGPVSLASIKTPDAALNTQRADAAAANRSGGSSMWLIAVAIVIILVLLGGAVAASFFLGQ